MAAPPTSEVAAQVAQTELFAALAPDALAEVARSGRVQALAKGTILFTQGTPAERCHALLAGRVRIAQSGTAGGQLIVRFVGPGEMFGTVALFTNRRYPADCSAIIDSLEISWSESTLLELIQRYPQIALNLVRIVGTRLREVEERLRELATERADQRIAHALLRLAERSAPVEPDEAAIEFPLTREDLAAMCGVTLYTVSRVLTTWEKAGYVTTHRKRLRIRKLSAIRKLAGEVPSSTDAGANHDVPRLR